MRGCHIIGGASTWLDKTMDKMSSGVVFFLWLFCLTENLKKVWEGQNVIWSGIHCVWSYLAFFFVAYLQAAFLWWSLFFVLSFEYHMWLFLVLKGPAYPSHRELTASGHMGRNVGLWPKGLGVWIPDHQAWLKCPGCDLIPKHWPMVCGDGLKWLHVTSHAFKR